MLNCSTALQQLCRSSSMLQSAFHERGHASPSSVHLLCTCYYVHVMCGHDIDISSREMQSLGTCTYMIAYCVSRSSRQLALPHALGRRGTRKASMILASKVLGDISSLAIEAWRGLDSSGETVGILLSMDESFLPSYRMHYVGCQLLLLARLHSTCTAVACGTFARYVLGTEAFALSPGPPRRDLDDFSTS